MEADLLPLIALLSCLAAAGYSARRLPAEVRPLAWIVLLDVALFGVLDWSKYAFVTTLPADYAELARELVDEAVLLGLIACAITAVGCAVVERGRGRVWPTVIATAIAALAMAACGLGIALAFTEVLWVGGR